MIEVLMETVATKLDSQSKKLQELEGMLTRICQSTQEVNSINKHLASLTDAIAAIPKEKKIVLHHRLHKMVGIGITSILVAATALCLLVNEKSKNASLKETDIKYRYIKLYGDQSASFLLHNADSLYRNSPAAFSDSVVNEEQRRQDQLELLRQAAQKEREVELLKQKARAR